MSTGVFDGVDELLDATQAWIDSVGADAPVRGAVADGEEYRRLPADVSVHRAGLALVRGDVEQTVAHARRALEQVGEDDHLTRGAAFALRGLAAWSTGDLGTAHESYAACMVEFELIDHVSDVLGCSVALGDIEVVLGRPRDGRAHLPVGPRAGRSPPHSRAAWSRRHARRAGRPTSRGRRPRRRPAESSRAAGSWASTPAFRRTPTAGAS